MKLSQILESPNIINKEGSLGFTPNNGNVDYLGARVHMKPSTFLSLASPLRSNASQGIEDHIENGGPIASPFLQIALPEEWRDGDFSKPARVYGHEGRNRMKAIMNRFGNAPVEVHLFFGEWRNRHITPEILDALNSRMIAQGYSSDIGLEKGPFFTKK